MGGVLRLKAQEKGQSTPEKDFFVRQRNRIAFGAIQCLLLLTVGTDCLFVERAHSICSAANSVGKERRLWHT
jgi:hypothetical protein